MERKPRKPIPNVLVATALTLGLLVACDVLLGWSTRDVRLERAQAIERRYRIPSPIYHYDLAKDASVDRAAWGHIIYPVRTNSLGFRCRSVQHVPLRSARHRIMFIGDSMTEGVGLPYPQTFVGLIEAGLADNDIEVLNAAVVSYSPIIYWRKVKFLIEDAGLRFKELIVFLDISDVEDEALHYFVDEQGKIAKRDVPLPSEGILNSVCSSRPMLAIRRSGPGPAAPAPSALPRVAATEEHGQDRQRQKMAGRPVEMPNPAYRRRPLAGTVA